MARSSAVVTTANSKRVLELSINLAALDCDTITTGTQACGAGRCVIPCVAKHTPQAATSLCCAWYTAGPGVQPGPVGEGNPCT